MISGLKSGFVFLLALFCISTKVFSQSSIVADVLVVGGGTGGTAAGLQAARLGVRVIIAEPGPWLGGMISAAGVSATDGNHRLSSGIWNEFRDKLYKVYGGPEKLATGWVSNTQFEPHVADSIFKRMCEAEKKLKVLFGLRFLEAIRVNNQVTGARFISKNDTVTIAAKLVIDATEMGDVLASAGAKYDLGMEAGSVTGEEVGVRETNNIVQDLTYVAILKDYGPMADCTIVKPIGYSPSEFDGACSDYCIDKTIRAPTSSARQMLDYGKLPGNKYLLNWPIKGNDSYLNIVELTDPERLNELVKAKQKTLRFIYFIQQQLGYKNLGLADDEFPTTDRLALMPYYREGRRVKGLVRFTINHISKPFSNGQALYRTGISVGDYPIDHHHKENPAAPQHLDFYPVPSFNVPMGALIPEAVDGLIVAEKGISVSNVVNGTTRLQPCVLLTGQAAGVLAALCIKQSLQPRAVPVRNVQQVLLDQHAYIMPYIDVMPGDPQFQSIQRIGATGILRGTGIPFQWANQTWFYPDSLVNVDSLKAGWQSFSTARVNAAGVNLTIHEAFQLVNAHNHAAHDNAQKPLVKNASKTWNSLSLKNFQPGRSITRREFAVLIDKLVDPFAKPVAITGEFTKLKGRPIGPPFNLQKEKLFRSKISAATQ